jgi:alkylation response protein AidB-like acyl-CoA dehydrogenase
MSNFAGDSAVKDYFGAGMRLYVDRLMDWEPLLTLRSGESVDVAAEVGAYRTILETVAALAADFEKPARENWSAEAELTPDGGAVPPAHMREAYAQLQEAGLVSLPVPEEYGGYGVPATMNGWVLEMISRADPSLMMIIGLQTGVANDIAKYGSEEIKRAFLPRFASGEVQGSMDLTEPQAGSDLGGIATRATDREDGQIQVDGQKIFISNGGAEVHLVLARDDDTFDQSKGTTNGLSLVLVPRHREDGSENGVRVTRLEKKIGIHGSPTCEMIFEGSIGARLGKKGQGFRAMLDLMNAARLGVASQALGLSDAAIHDATEYANQREQFGKTVAEQPLVMGMLAKMIVNNEAVRALLYRTYRLLDFNIAREAAVQREGISEAERSEIQAELERDTARVRLLTPLCKYFATEVCSDITRDAVQVFGGVGFTAGANVGKYLADSVITTIYEGTSEIQASFALREMGKGVLEVVLREVKAELDAVASNPELSPLADRIRSVIDGLDETLKVLFSDLNYALSRAKLMAETVIDVIAGAELLKQAAVDDSRRDIAEAFIRRRMLEAASVSRRIEDGAGSRFENDARIVAAVSRTGS